MRETIRYSGKLNSTYIIRGVGHGSCWVPLKKYLIGKLAVAGYQCMRIIGFSAEEKRLILLHMYEHNWTIGDRKNLEKELISCSSLLVERLDDPDNNY